MEFITIYQNQNITITLQLWLQKICTFCERMKMTDDNISNFFPSTNANQEIYGYVPITIANLQILVNPNNISNLNQRVLLTTIYRFAKVFAGILWKAILLATEDIKRLGTSVHKYLVDKTGNVLDSAELEVHSRFVLQKHGLSYNTNDDALKQLYDVFLRENSDNFFTTNSSTYPSIITSLTQPVGNDCVGAWMTYNGQNAVRVRRNPNEPFTQKGSLEVLLNGTETGSQASWKTGSMLYSVNENCDFAKMARKYNREIICGPSCTTQMMLDCALMFGIDVNTALIAIIPWMVAPGDHSLFEILIAANPYLISHQYTIDKKEIDFLRELFPNLPQNAGKIEKKKSKACKSKAKMSGGSQPFSPYCDHSGYVPFLIADAWVPAVNYAEYEFNSSTSFIFNAAPTGTPVYVPNTPNVSKQELSAYLSTTRPLPPLRSTVSAYGGKKKSKL